MERFFFAVLPHSWYSQQLLSVVDEYAKLGDDLVSASIFLDALPLCRIL